MSATNVIGDTTASSAVPASNTVPETNTPSTDEPIKQTTNTVASSSSYANVVLNLKPAGATGSPPPSPPQDDSSDSNKENIEKENKNNQSDVPPIAIKSTDHPTTETVTDGKPVARSEETATKSDLTGGDPDDDGSFTQVVSHNRKEKNRRDRNTKAKTGLSSRQNRSGGSGLGGGRSGQILRERRDAKRTKDKESRESKSNESTAAAITQQSEKPQQQNSGDPSASSDGTSKANSEDDAQETSVPVKFVAAPIPKVNAWKVSLVILSLLKIFLIIFK